MSNQDVCLIDSCFDNTYGANANRGISTTKGASLDALIIGIIIVFTVSVFFLANFVNAFAVGAYDDAGATIDNILEVHGNSIIYTSRATVLKPEAGTFDLLKPAAYSNTVYSSSILTARPTDKAISASSTFPGQTSLHSSSPLSSSPSSLKATLYLPSNKYVEATNRGGSLVSYSVSALDSLGNSIAPVCSPPSGTIFPLGKTTVTCTARDASGNTQTGSFDVIVQDTIQPDLIMPSTTITAEATGPVGTAVSFSISASDIVSGSITPICSTSSSHTAVSSGSIFPVGKTTVTCTAKDSVGNTQTGSFDVIVQDTTPPDLIFSGSSFIARAQSRATPVSYSGYVSSTDLVDGKVTPICSPPSDTPLPIGVDTIKCTAKDKHGNIASESFTITVRYPTFNGFLPPIRSDGSSIFKLGTVIPVKFQLKWSNADYVRDAAVQIYTAKISNSVTGTSTDDTSSNSLRSSPSSSAATTNGNYFVYDNSRQEYVYNLQTKNLSVGTWQIKILLDDGSSPSVNISIER
jgi:hypothetical protein